MAAAAVAATTTTTTKGDASYLAQPPGPCCWLGTIHEGQPRGTIETLLDDVPTYVARPPAHHTDHHHHHHHHIVLYFPDVWGLSPNAMLLMDGFADAGFLTVGMDYFRGDPISKYRQAKNDPLPEGFDHAAWRAKHWAFATENVPKWVAAVKAKYGSHGSGNGNDNDNGGDGDGGVQGVMTTTTTTTGGGGGGGGGGKTRYACTGYCFGAPFVCDLLAQEDVVSAGAFAHPTALKEEHFANIKQPLLLSCAENDHAFPHESRVKALEILSRDKKRYHMQLFHGVGHGFAVKGDPADPYQRWCKEQSLRAMVDWFQLLLVGTP